MNAASTRGGNNTEVQIIVASKRQGMNGIRPIAGGDILSSFPSVCPISLSKSLHFFPFHFLPALPTGSAFSAAQRSDQGETIGDS
jgi:hypothetical protein